MESFWVIVSAAGAVFAVIGLGAGLRRANVLTEQADASLLRLCINVLFPAFIADVLIGNPALSEARNVWGPPVVGFGLTALGFGVAAVFAYTAGRRIGLTTPAARRTFVLIVGMFNYGYIPIPLVQQMFDDATLGVLLVHNVGVDIAMWTLGVVIVSGSFLPGWWKKLLNMPLLAIAVSLSINALGGAGHVPPVIAQVLEKLGVCAIPMVLLLIGATIMDELRDADLRRGWGVMASGAALRLGLLPVLFIGGAWILPEIGAPVGVELQRVMAVEAAMPTAVFPILLARHYGGDPGTAVRVALTTSLLGLITIPVWLSAALAWLGLSPAP